MAHASAKPTRKASRPAAIRWTPDELSYIRKVATEAARTIADNLLEKIRDPASKERLGELSQSDKIGRPANGQKNGRSKPAKKKRFTRFAETTGTTWAARFGRGLTRWREKAKLTIPAAAEKYDVDQTCWYRIEKGNQPATTAKYVDRIAEVTGLDMTEIITLGTN